MRRGVTVRITKKMRDWLDYTSESTSTSVSALVRECLNKLRMELYKNPNFINTVNLNMNEWTSIFNPNKVGTDRVDVRFLTKDLFDFVNEVKERYKISRGAVVRLAIVLCMKRMPQVPSSPPQPAARRVKLPKPK